MEEDTIAKLLKDLAAERERAKHLEDSLSWSKQGYSALQDQHETKIERLRKALDQIQCDSYEEATIKIAKDALDQNNG